jgi:hypothetical protein
VRKSSMDFISVTGLITPNSSYNLRYTPAQIMKRHSNFFLGGIKRVDGVIRFASGEGNTKLQTQTGSGIVVNESQDWQKSELLKPLLNGDIYEFYHEVTYEIQKQLETDFFNLWEFETSEGKTIRGFIYNVKIREGIWQILGHR